MLCLCSNGSSVLRRSVTPRRRARGSRGLSLHPPTCRLLGRRYLRGLPVLVHEVSRRAVGSSTTPNRTGTRAIAPVHVAFRACLPRRRPDCMFSRLNSHPAYPLSTLRWVPRGSSARLEAKWFAIPFLEGFFLLCFMPVYPGALISPFHVRRGRHWTTAGESPARELGSLHPEAIRAAVEETKPSEPL